MGESKEQKNNARIKGTKMNERLKGRNGTMEQWKDQRDEKNNGRIKGMKRTMGGLKGTKD